MSCDELHIDLDAWRDVAYKGVRRAAVFLGFGLNAAHDPEFTDYRSSNQVLSMHLRSKSIRPSAFSLSRSRSSILSNSPSRRLRVRRS
jgi:hypothetical protein